MESRCQKSGLSLNKSKSESENGKMPKHDVDVEKRDMGNFLKVQIPEPDLDVYSPVKAMWEASSKSNEELLHR